MTLTHLGFFGFAYYVENSKKLKAVAIDNGKGAVAPFGEDRARRQLSAAFPPDLYLREQEGLGSKPEVREFVEFYLKQCSQADQGSQIRSAPG